jgi:hypothetical protein
MSSVLCLPAYFEQACGTVKYRRKCIKKDVRMHFYIQINERKLLFNSITSPFNLCIKDKEKNDEIVHTIYKRLLTAFQNQTWQR